MPVAGSSSLYRFLIKHLNEQTFQDKLAWIDRRKLTFQLIWTHGNRRESFMEDWKIVKQYEMFKGRKMTFDPKMYYKAKHNLKVSLKKMKLSKERYVGPYCVFKMNRSEVKKTGLLHACQSSTMKTVDVRKAFRILTNVPVPDDQTKSEVESLKIEPFQTRYTEADSNSKTASMELSDVVTNDSTPCCGIQDDNDTVGDMLEGVQSDEDVFHACRSLIHWMDGFVIDEPLDDYFENDLFN